jgi:hypothetical protein
MKKLISLIAIIISSYVTSIAEQPLNKIIINKFDRGLNNTSSASKLKHGQHSAGYNGIGSETGSLNKRKGFTQISSKDIDYAWLFEKSTGESWVLVWWNSNMYYTTNPADDSTYTEIILEGLQPGLTGISSDVLDDKIWFTDGGMTDVASWSGPGTWNTYDYIPHCKILKAWNNRLICANDFGESSTAWYSEIVGKANLDSINAWDERQAFFIGKNDGDFITSVFTLGGNLFFGKYNSTWKITGYAEDSWVKFRISDYYGFPYPRCIKSFKDFIIGPTNWDNIVLFDGNSYLDVSKDIKNTLDNVSNFAGQTDYINVTNSADFAENTYNLHTSTDTDDLEIEQITREWGEADDFDGTFSDTAIRNNSIITSESGLTHTKASIGVPSVQLTGSGGYVTYNIIDAPLNDTHYLIDGDEEDVAYTNDDYTIGNVYKPGSVFEYVGYYEFRFTLSERDYTKLSIKNLAIYVANDQSLDTINDVYVRVLTETSAGATKQLGYYEEPYSERNGILGDLDFQFDSDARQVENIIVRIGFYGEYHDYNQERYQQISKIKINRIGEIEIYYEDTAPTYKSTGTYTSADESFTVAPYSMEWGTITFTTSTPNGSTLTYETNSSTDNGGTWEGWLSCTNGGQIQSAAGTNLMYRINYDNTYSSYTATVYDVTVNTYYSSSTWRDAWRQSTPLYQRKNFVASETKPSGTNIVYRVRYSTYTGNDSASWSTYSSFQSEAGIASSYTWSQREVGMTTTDGRVTPQAHSLSHSWFPHVNLVVPVAEVVDRKYRINFTTYSTSNNLEYVLDESMAWWEMRGINANGYFTFNKEKYFYNSSGIYKMLQGYNDNGSDIEMLYETPDIVMDKDNKTVQMYYIDSRALQTGTTVEYAWSARDYENTFSTATKYINSDNGVDIYKINTPVMKNGKVFRFRIKEESSNAVEIQTIEPRFKPREGKW